MAAPSTGYEHLSLDDAARVDEACDHFEQAWKAARAGAYLEGVGGAGRDVLVRELIALDQDCRKRYGLPIRPEDYVGLDPPPGRRGTRSRSGPAGSGGGRKTGRSSDA